MTKEEFEKLEIGHFIKYHSQKYIITETKRCVHTVFLEKYAETYISTSTITCRALDNYTSFPKEIVFTKNAHRNINFLNDEDKAELL